MEIYYYIWDKIIELNLSLKESNNKNEKLQDKNSLLEKENLNVEFEHIEYKIKIMKNAEEKKISHDIDNINVFDDKFKLFIKENFEKNCDLVISLEFLNTISKMGHIKEVIGKCKRMLKIKKCSTLFDKTINNQKIYKESLDPDELFLYLIARKYYIYIDLEYKFYCLLNYLIQVSK